MIILEGKNTKKGFGARWKEIDSDKLRELNALITIPDFTGETEIRGKTSLRFFTEYDDLYDEVFAKDSGWVKAISRCGD
uniref:Uncharacterized protein n=1 Tax=viral metagenome TaxID=1070528 RepID=A0A6M3JEV0_9ZZZZ